MFVHLSKLFSFLGSVTSSVVEFSLQGQRSISIGLSNWMLASKVELDWIFSVHICSPLFLPTIGLPLRALKTGSLFPVAVCFCCRDVGLHFDIGSFKPGSTTYFWDCIVPMCFKAVVILHFKLFLNQSGPELSSALFLGGLCLLPLLTRNGFCLTRCFFVDLLFVCLVSVLVILVSLSLRPWRFSLDPLAVMVLLSVSGSASRLLGLRLVLLRGSVSV
jgi:hypothetical protein